MSAQRGIKMSAKSHIRSAIAVLSLLIASLAMPPQAGAAWTWTPPAGLPDGFPSPPTNFMGDGSITVSPRIARKGDIVTISSPAGAIPYMKVYAGFPTNGSLSVQGTCEMTSTSCQFKVGAYPNSWQGWIAIGANVGSGELGPYEALAVLPTTDPVTPPSAPTNVKATGSKGAATVTWSGSTNPGGAPIIGYRVTTYDAVRRWRFS